MYSCKIVVKFIKKYNFTDVRFMFNNDVQLMMYHFVFSFRQKILYSYYEYAFHGTSVSTSLKTQ